MNLVWERFTLSYLPIKEYLNTSYLHRSLVGLVSSWRQTSILIQWGDIIAVALLSVVYGITPFVADNTKLVGLLLAACAGFWLLLTVSDETFPRDTPTVTPIHLLVLLYWAIAIVATALAPVKKAAFSDLVTLTLYLPLFPLCARVLRSSRLRSWLITFYLHISLIVSIYGVRQWFFGARQLATWVDPESSLSKITRVYSYLNNPNLLAGYLMSAVVLSFVAIFAWQSRFKKALALTMLVVNGSCLILTFSRGAWIGLLIAVLVLLPLLHYWWSPQMPPFWRTWFVWIVLGGLAGLLILGMVLSDPLRERIFSIFADRSDSSNNFRKNVWAGVFKMIADYPLTGIGPGHNSFNQIYPFYLFLPSYTALSAYSIFLEITVETGLIGLASFVWLIIVTFNTGFLQLRRLLELRSVGGVWLNCVIARFIGQLCYNMFYTVWDCPFFHTVWWLMVALIASYYMPGRQEQSSTRHL
ncbi:IctB family putative bicarbonate transporter [Aetokthonos hydrillicola]|uniref:IctB family putative bicarbonate transporter n=1 Tax=Aetokthonos hydrillicola TaxID=1550245 RepID=UPI001ABB08EE|nr:IctB family putative bicarbonate transporter [Aetokthonos hydrillicola]MBO3462368.1 putative bicarbonate transporter, IctB family [Aetokthonos hydrillicola CCALA 1050]